MNPGAWSGKEWHAAPDAAAHRLDQPGDGRVICAHPRRGRGGLRARDGEQRRGFRRLARQFPAPQRGEAVRLMADALRAKKDLLGSLVSLEMGKIKAEGDGEVQEMIDIADFAVGQSRMLYGLSMHSERPRHRMYEQWHPLGVVGIISRLQFPGRGLVVERVPRRRLRRHLRLEALAPHAALRDRGAEDLQRSHRSGEAAADLPALHRRPTTRSRSRFVDDRRVALMSFTGSTSVGRHVGERVASRLGRSLLELGGNNAIIVDEFANLDLVVPAVLFGSVGTAGQRCTTTRRAPRPRVARIDEARAAAGRKLQAGEDRQSARPEDLMGPLVGASAVRQFESALTDARSQGGEIRCGGNTLPGPGYFVEPTIVRAPQ